MVKEVLFCYAVALLIDILSIYSLRDLVYSFLLTKRNLKGAKKIHLSQTKKERFTLSYIREYALFPKEFHFYQRCWIIYISSLLPVYLLIIIANLFSTLFTIVLVGCIYTVKFVFLIFGVRSQFVGRISRYDKRASKYDD